MRKALVLSSNGGYCHVAATKALKAHLGDGYQLEVAYPIDEVQFFGTSNGEDLYNQVLQNHWYRSLNLIGHYVVPSMVRLYKEKAQRLVFQHIERVNPDIVISLIPWINLPASCAAQQAKRPFLLVTLDSDLTIWSHGLNLMDHTNFAITVIADFPSTTGILEAQSVPPSAIRPIGFPVGPEFAYPRSPAKLREKWQIPKERRMILIMMGGAGGEHAYNFAKRLSQLHIGAHIVVVCGKHDELVRQLQAVEPHPTNKLVPIGFTDKIAELMAMADLFISKPGPGSIHEAMQYRLPILLDAIGEPVFWEKPNLNLVAKYGIGEAISSMGMLDDAVIRHLTDDELRQEIAEAYSKIPSNNFATKITKIADELIDSAN